MAKKALSFYLFGFWMFCFMWVAVLPLRAQEVKAGTKIAVFPFADTNPAAKETGYGDAIAGMLTTELINGKVFQIIERKEIERIMGELGLNQLGVVDSKTAKEIGKVYGVDMLVFGNVAKFGSLVETDSRLIDTQSGEAVLADHASCRNESEIRNMVVNLARKMEERFTHRSTAEMVIESVPTGATVYIDGIAAGTTPLSKTMSYGKYLLEISLTNYRSWEKAIVLDQAEQKISAQLVSLTAPTASTPSTPPPSKKGGSKTWLYLVGGAALVGGGVAALTMGQDKKESANSNVTITVTIP